jgi:hypothetical protein
LPIPYVPNAAVEGPIMSSDKQEAPIKQPPYFIPAQNASINGIKIDLFIILPFIF